MSVAVTQLWMYMYKLTELQVLNISFPSVRVLSVDSMLYGSVVFLFRWRHIAFLLTVL
jgi:hypothetical protein